MATEPTSILSRVSTLQQDDSSEDIYDDWSSDYDADLLSGFGYISPVVAAAELAGQFDRRDIDIIDFGCGTGLVGVALQQQGFIHIDGADISSGMLDQARQKQVYRHLICADLTTRIPLDDDSYDAGLCIGSLGAGHVGAQHVAEMLRPLRPGGHFIIIMNGSYYHSGGFEASFHELQESAAWSIQKLKEFNYMTELDRPGWLLVANKL